MLVELVVRDLGVIAEARLELGAGMTVLTGETGAGKTMLVEALRLLSGGRPDPQRVRAGAEAAAVEALFVVEDTEWVLRRVVPARGRSRSYLNGELCTSETLAGVAVGLLEIHGQHAQQQLLQPRSQRAALDRFGGIDTTSLDAARRLRRELVGSLDALGGDERAREREVELLLHQVQEIEAVAPEPGEEVELRELEDVLSSALEHRAAGEAAVALLCEDGAVLDRLAAAEAAVLSRSPFGALAERLRGVHAELSDVASTLRSCSEAIEPDPQRLASIQERRRQLAELRRKYGDDAEEVLSFAESARQRLLELQSMEVRRGEVAERISATEREIGQLAHRVGEARRAAAAALGPQLDSLLGDLALGGARVEVSVEDREELPGAGSEVELRFAAAPASTPMALSKVASGGELSRVMLALRLLLSGGPTTMAFDEVDAGVGGAAAQAVGRALAELSERHQVLVVTHLPQVAAHADAQFVVSKSVIDGDAVTSVEQLDDDARVVELSRMLSGSPQSSTARRHAEELLSSAAERAGTRRR
jgi:DNA repair protein RecN (Recombination protein N)